MITNNIITDLSEKIVNGRREIHLPDPIEGQIASFRIGNNGRGLLYVIHNKKEFIIYPMMNDKVFYIDGTEWATYENISFRMVDNTILLVDDKSLNYTYEKGGMPPYVEYHDLKIPKHVTYYGGVIFDKALDDKKVTSLIARIKLIFGL